MTTNEWMDGEPYLTSVSFRVDDGTLVPVAWDVGPVFCAYCKEFKSTSFQAIYKHLMNRHKEKAEAHRERVRKASFRSYRLNHEKGFQCRFEDGSHCIKFMEDEGSTSEISKRKNEDELQCNNPSQTSGELEDLSERRPTAPLAKKRCLPTSANRL